MKRLNYTISDFCISAVTGIPPKVADAILRWWILPLDHVQQNAPFDIFVSYSKKGQPSGWRSWLWEIARGRNGKSQHTFGQRQIKLLASRGACDITCDDFKDNKDKLLELLIEHTEIIRFAVYNTFIHCDYKDTHPGQRLIFSSNAQSKWKFIRFV